MSEKLIYVESMHEQREFNNRIVPIVGSWLEIGDFEKVTEHFKINERWECTNVDMAGEGDAATLAVELKRLDHEAEFAESRIIIDSIMEKHKESLIESLRYMIINGLTAKSDAVSNYRKNEIRERLSIVGLSSESAEIQILQTKKKLESAQKRVDALKKEISDLEGKNES